MLEVFLRMLLFGLSRIFPVFSTYLRVIEFMPMSARVFDIFSKQYGIPPMVFLSALLGL